ncbi:thioesterase II family protein [Amycolatopsis vancoresmycina]|uniref:Pyochelin biosynthetic protein n=1 Tax=Amycolatopsis vancoresmycina DSM 44592 TaxID=1292037 RepID=R1HV48_9PSEU|nr:alpha/beta fold hydrolase [Amycolatopsis vancoresmycina]EOD67410.1 pyochelin biosynthetic protein [Amycolatopsis vancoresmycina DSM 44592]
MTGCRYLLLPPAGGTTGIFRHVVAASAAADVWAAEYPGRGDRLDAPPARSLERLAEQLTGELLRRDPAWVRQTVLVGFSMGAFLAVEVAQRLRTRCGPAPAAVVVIGAPAPQRRVPGRYAQVGEESLQEVLDGEGFVPGLGNRASFELWAYAVELLRHDVGLTAAYRGPATTALHCPLAALCGEDDPVAADDATEAWRMWTADAFLASTVPGGHLGLLAPGRGAEFWTWMGRIERRVVAAGVCDA